MSDRRPGSGSETDRDGSGRNAGLFARAQSGDQDAWQELFEACNPKVRRAVVRKLGSQIHAVYGASDFTSDVWKSLAAKSDRFEFESVDKLIAFLIQSVERKVIDEHRRRHALKNDTDRNRPLSGLSCDPVGHDPSPSQLAVANEMRERLATLEEGPARRIVELKEKCYNNEEVAEATGMQVRQVQRVLKGVFERLTAGRR